jgi:hypothetical protein
MLTIHSTHPSAGNSFRVEAACALLCAEHRVEAACAGIRGTLEIQYCRYNIRHIKSRDDQFGSVNYSKLDLL